MENVDLVETIWSNGVYYLDLDVHGKYVVSYYEKIKGRWDELGPAIDYIISLMEVKQIKSSLKSLGWTYKDLARELSTPSVTITEGEIKGWMAGTRGLSKMGKVAMYMVLHRAIIIRDLGLENLKS